MVKLTPKIIQTKSGPGLEWIKKELSNWPTDSCFDTCNSIVEDLRRNLREWKFTVVHGYFAVNAENEEFKAHVWMTAKLRGQTHFKDPLVIVDPTAGQFLKGTPIKVFYVGDQNYSRYLPGRRLPSWTQTMDQRERTK